MFGCTAIYVEEKIVFILRDKKDRDDEGASRLAPARTAEPPLDHRRQREFPSARGHCGSASRETFSRTPCDALHRVHQRASHRFPEKSVDTAESQLIRGNERPRPRQGEHRHKTMMELSRSDCGLTDVEGGTQASEKVRASQNQIAVAAFVSSPTFNHLPPVFLPFKFGIPNA